MRALTSLGKAQLALLAALALTAAIGVGLAAYKATLSTPSTSASRTTLSVRDATAGPVQIKITPVRLDTIGAASRWCWTTTRST